MQCFVLFACLYASLSHSWCASALWCLKVRRRGFNITLRHLRPGLAQPGRHHFVPAPKNAQTNSVSTVLPAQLHRLSKLNMVCELELVAGTYSQKSIVQ